MIVVPAAVYDAAKKEGFSRQLETLVNFDVVGFERTGAMKDFHIFLNVHRIPHDHNEDRLIWVNTLDEGIQKIINKKQLQHGVQDQKAHES